MSASAQARREGDAFTANAYKKQAQRTIRTAHPLKGDKKLAGLKGA